MPLLKSQAVKAIDVVLSGFDTYTGFYKAFVKMYGCSPRSILAFIKSISQNAQRW